MKTVKSVALGAILAVVIMVGLAVQASPSSAGGASLLPPIFKVGAQVHNDHVLPRGDFSFQDLKVKAIQGEWILGVNGFNQEAWLYVPGVPGPWEKVA